MKRAVSNCTESTVDEAVVLNQELSRRQREYRIMENEKKQKCIEMEYLMQKQKAAIKQLEKEQTEIATEMKLAASLKNRKQDAANTRHIKEFTKRQIDYSTVIQNERDAIKEVDREIAEIENKIQGQRKAMGGVHNSHLRHLTTSHTIKVLENRLDKATREFNSLTADNSKLRGEIQHLRNQRGVFDNIFKRLRKEMGHKKHEQNLLIEKSALAYDQRDEAEQKMAALKERNSKNLTQYHMEYKELLRQLDHDTCLKKFLLDKAEERWEQAEEQIQQRKQNFEDKSESSAATTLNQYKKAFDDVRTITGATEPEELIKQFIKMEDENFALFNYVNEINNQLQQYDDEIKLLDRDVRDCQLTSDKMLEEKTQTISVETERLALAAEKMESSESSLRQTNEVMEKLKQGISSIFEHIGCSSDAMKSHLGDQSTVNDVNVLKYLAEIEDKTNDVVQQFVLLQMKQEVDAATLVTSPTVKSNDNKISAPAIDPEQNENKETSKEVASPSHSIHDLFSLRKLANESCKTREIEKKNLTNEKQNGTTADKNTKSRKK